MTTVPGETENRSNAELFLAKHEVYLHVAIFVVAVIVLLMSFSMTLVERELVFLPGFSKPLPESCTAKLYFGIDCPACGLTRAFISISSGKFSDAWNFNPASFVVYLFFAAQIPWQGYQLWRLSRGQQSYDRIWIYWLPLAMAVTLIVQWAVRLAFG